jgi:hypothetical protein
MRRRTEPLISEKLAQELTEKFRGQWVAIKAGKVIASSPPNDLPRLLEIARAEGAVLHRVPRNTLYILAGQPA